MVIPTKIKAITNNSSTTTVQLTVRLNAKKGPVCLNQS